MDVQVISFASRAFLKNRQRLRDSARRAGLPPVQVFTEDDLLRTPYYEAHRAIFDQKRGFGYWLWKPYFIQEALRRAPEGSVVFYVDSGVDFVKPVDPLLALTKQQPIVLFDSVGRKNRYWTKRDCFVRMGCDSEAYYESPNLTASFQLYRNVPEAVRFVREWLTYCEDPAILTDMESKSGAELPDFLDHRHDQSVLSLLAAKHGLEVFRDPSQWGNHAKLEAFREPGEWTTAPYLVEGLKNSPYGTLINHHRSHVSMAMRVAKKIHRTLTAGRRQRAAEALRDAVFPRASLMPAVQQNRQLLATVDDWLDPAGMAASQFHYGLPQHLWKHINRPIGDAITYSDCLLSLAKHLSRRIEYLEIGVSVGKNFLQMVGGLTEARLTGFDIEEISPVLARRLTLVAEEKWPASRGSAKANKVSSLRTFRYPGNNNAVQYLSGDVFDETCWQRLAGRKFNLVFSDALHWPEGIVQEWAMIERYDLLDREEFVAVWDDLGGVMDYGFRAIWRRVIERFGREDVYRLHLPIYGWLGRAEAPHQVGIIIKSAKIAQALNLAT